MSTRIVDVAERDHLEMFEGADYVGLLNYQRAKHLLIIEHTEIVPGRQGRGFGSQLVEAAFDQAKSEELRVIVVCPFAKNWLQRHPEYAGLDYNHT